MPVMLANHLVLMIYIWIRIKVSMDTRIMILSFDKLKLIKMMITTFLRLSLKRVSVF